MLKVLVLVIYSKSTRKKIFLNDPPISHDPYEMWLPLLYLM